MKPVDHTPGEWLPLKKVFANVTKISGDDAVLALHDIKRRLANGEVVAMVRTLTSNIGQELPATFWQAHRFSSVAPGHIIVPSKEFPPRDYRYFLRRSDVDRLWPARIEPVADADETRQPWPRKSSPAGAKGDYDWPKILLEGVKYMLDNGPPKSLTELGNHIEDCFGKGAPGETQLKSHLRPFYEAFKEANAK
jgi:hypothetical protein